MVGIGAYVLPMDAPVVLSDVGRWPYLLGTDALGRNILVRLLRGAWWSVGLGFGSMQSLYLTAPIGQLPQKPLRI